MDFFAPSCAFGSAAVWAVASVGYSQISKDHSVFAVNFARAAIALPLFLLSVVFVSGGILNGFLSFQEVQYGHLGWLSLSVLTSFAFGDAAFFWSTRFIGVSTAMAIAFSYPVWTVLIGALFFGEAISQMQFLGVLLTTLGVIAAIVKSSAVEFPSAAPSNLVLPDPILPENILPDQTLLGKIETAEHEALRLRKKRWIGIFGAFLTSLLWSINSFATSRVAITAAVGNSIRMLIALLLLVGIGKLFVPAGSFLLPLNQVRRFLWVFVLEAFCGTFLYVYGLSHSSLAIGVTLSSLSPVLAVPVAVLLKTEKFSLLRTLGVCLVVAGVSLLMSSS